MVTNKDIKEVYEKYTGKKVGNNIVFSRSFIGNVIDNDSGCFLSLLFYLFGGGFTYLAADAHKEHEVSIMIFGNLIWFFFWLIVFPAIGYLCSAEVIKGKKIPTKDKQIIRAMLRILENERISKKDKEVLNNHLYDNLVAFMIKNTTTIYDRIKEADLLYLVNFGKLPVTDDFSKAFVSKVKSVNGCYNNKIEQVAKNKELTKEEIQDVLSECQECSKNVCLTRIEMMRKLKGSR